MARRCPAMGLSAWLRQRAAIAPLIVTAPGGTGARLAVERVVREKGWLAAQTPAGANLVIVAGTPAADFEAYLLRLMATVPEPHERVDITEADDAVAKLTTAIARMRSIDSAQAIADTASPASNHRGHEDADAGTGPTDGDHEPAQHHTAGHEHASEARGHHDIAHSPSGHDADPGHEHPARQHGMPQEEPGPGGATPPYHVDESHRAEPSTGAEEEVPQDDSAAASRDRPNPAGNAHEHRSHEHDHDMGKAGGSHPRGNTGPDRSPPPVAHGHPGHEHGDASGAHHHDHRNDQAEHVSHGGESPSHAGMEHGGTGHDNHGGREHHSEHGGHEHNGHDMGMALPGGLVMADRAPDRDGLMLDVLTLPLGPVAASWPSGLALTTRMQGDVIDEVTVSVLSPSAHLDPFRVRPWLHASEGVPMTVGEGERYSAAWRFDSAAALLAVAGWRDAAAVAYRLRDELLNGETPEHLQKRLDRWARQVSSSRVLRWSLRRVGHIAEGPEVPAELVGDVHDRLLRWVHDIANLGPRGETPLEPGEYVKNRVACARWIVGSLPDLLRGVEVAEARLIVASLAPDVELLTWSSNSREAAHD